MRALALLTVMFATSASAATLSTGTLSHVSETIVVTAKSTFRNLGDAEGSLIGIADTASSGVVTAAHIEARALTRPADVLETVPGIVVSQHSGEGKANQYYLRGFNLDHGTDLATTVAGAPVNMPTHAHGQGYTDLNFVIPELISGVQFKKGPYFADEGDFSSAGAANINYANWLEQPIVSLTSGRFGYQRALAAGSRMFRGSTLLGAIEVSRNDGPWLRPDDFRKINGLLRLTAGRGSDVLSVTLSGYSGRWNATDQIPVRAVSSGLLSRFGYVDGSDGGTTHRYAATAEWQRRTPSALTHASAYVISYGLDLFSNFTYFLDDPENGDQFEQFDERVVMGGKWSRQWLASRFEHRVGVDVRRDDIARVGLYHTATRKRLDTIRENSLVQTSAGAYAQTTAQWLPWLRTVTGLRADGYRFDSRDATILSPKLNLILGPWRETELYLSAGSGFHSNDARGVAIDATPLVRTRGAELGLRWRNMTFAVWALDADSELVFVGDAGTTEAGPASRRRGVEWTNDWRVTPHVVVDADVAWSRGRFENGDRIPGAVEGVVSAGVSLVDYGRFSGSLRGRWLGPRPLIEDDTVRSSASKVLTADVGYRINSRMRVVVEGLNLTNSRASDIDYFYTSRLPGEPAGGVDGIHTHPLEPRSLRVRFEITAR